MKYSVLAKVHLFQIRSHRQNQRNLSGDKGSLHFNIFHTLILKSKPKRRTNNVRTGLTSFHEKSLILLKNSTRSERKAWAIEVEGEGGGEEGGRESCRFSLSVSEWRCSSCAVMSATTLQLVRRGFWERSRLCTSAEDHTHTRTLTQTHAAYPVRGTTDTQQILAS